MTSITRRHLLKLIASGLAAMGVERVLLLKIFGQSGGLDQHMYLPLVHNNELAPTLASPVSPTLTSEPTNTPSAEPTASVTPSATPPGAPTDTPTPTATNANTPTATPTPQITGTPWVASGSVVHVHTPGATSWTTGLDYWNHVDQTVVNTMVDAGLEALTSASSAEAAWRTILPNYQSGQKIAIKVNFNHSWETCGDVSGKIDALIQPVNAVVRGLKSIGVAESDIWVFDAIRFIPDRFVTGCLYSGVRFFDDRCREASGFNSSNPYAYVDFSPPAGVPALPDIKITDVLVAADYLINMPILKYHASAEVTFGFKNHLGSVDYPRGFHDYILLSGSYFRSDYNPLVDLYRNLHIGTKTILTLGDGLIGARRWSLPDTSWTTFGGTVPNSLFFATDPVAIDSVMYDVLAAERSILAGADNYLALAAAAGLGVYEHGNPWGSGYAQIAYSRITL